MCFVLGENLVPVAILIYDCFKLRLCSLAIERMRRIESMFTTGEFFLSSCRPIAAFRHGHINELYALVARHMVYVFV